MSYIPTTVIIAGAVAAAARARKEEEEMTNYKSDDLDGWEFKIVRSTWGKFSSQVGIEKVCREEAEAGWEMLELFDKHRIRFKRRVERRSSDQHLGLDPYRGTASSSGSGMMVALVLGIVFLIAGGAFMFMNTISRGGEAPMLMVSLIAVAIIGLGLAVVFKKRRG